MDIFEQLEYFLALPLGYNLEAEHQLADQILRALAIDLLGYSYGPPEELMVLARAFLNKYKWGGGLHETI